MKGVILAGGKGTRLKPLTLVANKHLLPVYNKPMIEYPIGTLKALGISDILIVTGGEYIGRFAELLGDGSRYDCNFTYKVQEKADGIAGALKQAEDFIGFHEDYSESFVVCLGDNIFDNKQFEGLKLKHDNKAMVFGKQVDDPERFGVPSFMRDGRIKKIVEKPKDPSSRFAITGLYKFPEEVFTVIESLVPSQRGEYEVTDINNYYIENGLMEFSQLEGFWSDAGTIDSLLECGNWAKDYDIQ